MYIRRKWIKYLPNRKGKYSIYTFKYFDLKTISILITIIIILIIIVIEIVSRIKEYLLIRGRKWVVNREMIEMEITVDKEI